MVTVSIHWIVWNLYSHGCDDTYLAGALSAAVHRPFLCVLVHNSVVDADSAVHVYFRFQLYAFLRLWEKKRGEKRGLLRMDCGKFHFAKDPVQMNHWLTPWWKHCLTLASSANATDSQLTHLCIYMSLIKNLATRYYYSDKCTGNALTGSRGKDWEKRREPTVTKGKPWRAMELTTLRRSMDSFLTTTPSPLSSLNMLAMSSQEKPQTGWISEYGGEKNK